MVGKLRLPPPLPRLRKVCPPSLLHELLFSIRCFWVLHLRQAPGAEFTLSTARGWELAAGRAFLVLSFDMFIEFANLLLFFFKSLEEGNSLDAQLSYRV